MWLVSRPARGREQGPVALVALAVDAGCAGRRVQHVLELGLDEGALLLDDEDGVEPLGEATRALRLQRKRHRDLVEPDAEPPRRGLVDAEVLERLADIEVGLAGGRDPEPRPVRVPHRAVEPVGAAERPDRLELALIEPLLLLLRRVRPADPETLGGKDGIVGDDDPDPLGVDLHRGGGLDGVVDALQRGPAAAVARERESVEAVVEDLLHAGRVEHRNGGVDHRVLAVVRGGGRLAGVVVAEQRHHPAEPRRPGEVRVAQRVARAVDARSLAVPQAEHAVVRALAVELGLLRAPAGGGRNVLVDAGLEHHVVLLQVRLRPIELQVEPAERRAAVAADVAGGVVPGREVPAALVEHEPHQRLDTGEEDASVLAGVLVVEVDGGELYGRLTHGRTFLSRASRDGTPGYRGLDPSGVAVESSPGLPADRHDRVLRAGSGSRWWWRSHVPNG